MATITYSQEDITQVEAFLTSLVQEQFPDADFSPGSVLRDHVINPIALIAAVFRGEVTRVRDVSSLISAANLEDDDERLQAVLRVASNWFVTPRSGNRVRGTVTIHFSQQITGSIPTTVFFSKFAGIRFRLDRDIAYPFDATDLLPNVNAQGEIEDYILRVPVIAEFTGNNYAIPAGPFSVTTSFNPYVLFVENETAFLPVVEPETAEELSERIPGAITQRTLSSDRSIAAVLQDEFGFIDRILTLGHSDPGMTRDLISVTPTFANVHVGGSTDVYIGADTQTFQTYTGVVGETFTDPRADVVRFRDDSIDDFRRYVRPGAVLRIYNAALTEPTLYLIAEISENFLRIEPRQPFPDARPVAQRNGVEFTTGQINSSNTLRDVNATFSSRDVGRYIRIENSVAGNDGSYRITAVSGDTVTLDNAALTNELPPDFSFRIFDSIVDYSVGDNADFYDNMISRRTTGEFSRLFAEDGAILLPQEPLYLIRSVELLSPADADANPITGRVEFPVRVNTPPVRQSGQQLSFQVEIEDPAYGGSNEQFATLRVGFEPDQTGTDGALDLVNNFTAASATFTVADVGKTLRIADAFTLNNRGEFLIQSVTSPTVVVLTNPRDPAWTSTAEAAMDWELVDIDRFNGFSLLVVYDTVANFESVASFAQDDSQHDITADLLVRAFHPVYLGFEIRYSVRPIAASAPSEEDIISALVSFINAFPEDDIIDVSDIVTAFQNTNPDLIGNVELPLTITYTLYAPDGRSIPYATQDAVVIDDIKSTALTDDERLLDPEAIGVTDQTVRYLSDPELITLTRVS